MFYERNQEIFKTSRSYSYTVVALFKNEKKMIKNRQNYKHIQNREKQIFEFWNELFQIF